MPTKELFEELPESYIQLINACCYVDPSRRPYFVQLQGELHEAYESLLHMQTMQVNSPVSGKQAEPRTTSLTSKSTDLPNSTSSQNYKSSSPMNTAGNTNNSKNKGIFVLAEGARSLSSLTIEEVTTLFSSLHLSAESIVCVRSNHIDGEVLNAMEAYKNVEEAIKGALIRAKARVLFLKLVQYRQEGVSKEVLLVEQQQQADEQ